MARAKKPQPPKKMAMNLKAGEEILHEGQWITLATVSEPFQHEQLPDRWQIRISSTVEPGVLRRLMADQMMEVREPAAPAQEQDRG